MSKKIVRIVEEKKRREEKRSFFILMQSKQGDNLRLMSNHSQKQKSFFSLNNYWKLLKKATKALRVLHFGPFLLIKVWPVNWTWGFEMLGGEILSYSTTLRDYLWSQKNIELRYHYCLEDLINEKEGPESYHSKRRN